MPLLRILHWSRSFHVFCLRLPGKKISLCVSQLPSSSPRPAANTSCGLPLKMLRKTPIYTCGTYLVMLIPPPGGSGSSATRSLFGGSSSLSSLKSEFSSLSALRGRGESLGWLCWLWHFPTEVREAGLTLPRGGFGPRRLSFGSALRTVCS